MGQEQNKSRREFVTKAAYVAPAIISLAATPAYARVGSVKPPIKIEPPITIKPPITVPPVKTPPVIITPIKPGT
jgi:hypothetical protein